MLKINDANNFRRTLAGLCLITAPLAFGGSDVIRLSIEGGVRGSEQLAAMAASPGLWQLTAVLNMVGVVLFVPAILGLMHLLRERSTVLGHVGGGLALMGFLGWAAHNRGYYGFMGAASTSEIDRGEMVRFIGHWETTPDTIVYVLMFLVGHLLGMLLLSIGLYRARVTYRWAAALFLLGSVLYIVNSFSPASESMLAVGVLHALIAVGLGATGVRVLAMSDADWGRLRVAPAAETAPVGAQPRVQ
jgi:uncharacterized membrane protein YgdD (TMEM256/DUF423 family)